MITGISHITLIVRNLDAASDFLREIFGAKEVYASEEKQFSLYREKFFLVNDIWICLMEGESLSERTYNHIAFSIADSDFESYVSRIQAAGVEIKPARPRVEGEGRSIYFYDFDNHLFELHTGTLEERLERYSKNDMLTPCR